MRSTIRDVKGGGRIVRGSVSATGAITGGVGFTVIRNAAGDYTITFFPKFTSIPHVVASQHTSQISWCTPTQESLESVRIFTYTNAVGLADAAFSFVAMEQEL